MEKRVYWTYERPVGYFVDDEGNTKTLYYKEGVCHSSATLPTGIEAADLCEGSLVRFSDNGKVKSFDKTTGEWVLLCELSAGASSV